MHVIIVGGGLLGKSLAENLIGDKIDVTIIEKDEAVCNILVETVDAKIINGDATDLDILKESGTEGADFLITTVGNDQTSLLICMLVKSNFEVSLGARLTNASYRRIFEEANIRIITSPETAGGQELEFMITEPDVLTMASEHKAGVSLLELNVNEKSSIKDSKVYDLEENDTFRFVSIKRKDKFLIPTPETIIEQGDNVIIIVKKGSENKIRKMF